MSKQEKPVTPAKPVTPPAKKKEEPLELEGVVVESVKGAFRVEIPQANSAQKHIVYCNLSGKLRKNFIKIVPGDRVRIEVTPYDLTRGRIVYREK